MMLAILLLGLSQQQEDATFIRQRQTLTLPGEIAPAMAPYLMCMLEDHNERIIGLRSGNAVRTAIEQLKADCRSERDEAAARAREMLRTSHIAEAEQETMISGALNSIDHSRDNVAERLDRANSPQNEAAD